MRTLEAAHKGTIFLDEIGDIPLSVQVKLLRVLEERMIQRGGGNKSIPIDVRIITATNKDLEEMIAQGRFREDLYFRINVFPLVCPPLRQRKEDITLIIQHVIAIHANKTGKNILGFAPEAMRCMVSYPWPGNIRELKNTVEYAFVLARGKAVRPEHLPEKLLGGNPLSKVPSTGKERFESGRATLLEIGKDQRLELIDALQWAQGNQTRAASILGVSRVTVWKRMKKYKIKMTPG